jgi:hypothetical protein
VDKPKKSKALKPTKSQIGDMIEVLKIHNGYLVCFRPFHATPETRCQTYYAPNFAEACNLLSSEVAPVTVALPR